MRLCEGFNVDISVPQTQYLKTFPKFSRCAELQPLRASRTLSFPQVHRFGVFSFNANEGEKGGSKRRVGVFFHCLRINKDNTEYGSQHRNKEQYSHGS